MEKERAIKLLQKQVEKISVLRNQKRFSQDFQKWKRDTEIAIEKIFGNETRHINDFKIIKYTFPKQDSLFPIPESEINKKYILGLNNAHTLLKSMIDEIIEYSDIVIDKKIDGNPIVIIEKICNRFHLIAKQLRIRHDKRNTIEICDEYDVQDLLHSLLKLEFDDIRAEEWTPSYAGNSSRMDFLIKKEEIVIEVKKTRINLAKKELADQLLIDIQRYKSHHNCKTLICFIYDPEGLIQNPAGLENDLTKTEDNLKIVTLISPKGI